MALKNPRSAGFLSLFLTVPTPGRTYLTSQGGYGKLLFYDPWHYAGWGDLYDCLLLEVQR